MRLVIWDVDGTLVDSRAVVLQAMQAAYAALDLPAPDDASIMGQVGRSLELIFPDLSPNLDPRDHSALAEAYRQAYFRQRMAQGSAATSPFFPGARAALDALAAQPMTLQAVATGKSRRGLHAMIEGHGLQGRFQSLQTADDHPSKPHPSMVLACLSETGIDATRAVMVGDTTYDMDMARAAGVATIAVPWGNHPAEHLDADSVIADFADLPAVLDDLIGAADE